MSVPFPDMRLLPPKAAERLKLLGEARVMTAISRLAFPSIASLGIIAVYNVVDAVYVSRLGTAQLAAISVAFPVFAAVGGLGAALGSGAASWISRLLGVGDSEEADRIASTAFFASIGVGIGIASLALAFLPSLLRLLGATPTILPYALDYARILILANIVTMLNVAMANMVRAEGNAGLALLSVLVSGGGNLLLDPVFIFLLGMGIRGAALATVVSQIGACVLLAATYLRHRNRCRIRLRSVSVGRGVLLRLLRTGAPAFFLQFLGSIALAAINVAARAFGDAAIASVGLTFRVIALGMYLVHGYGQALQPVAGYNYGARRFDRVFRAVRFSFRLILAFSIVFALLVFAGADIIVSFLTGDPDVAGIAVPMLRAVSSMFPFFALQIGAAFLFQALGRPLAGALIIVARQAVFFLPTLILLPRYFGLPGLMASQPVTDFLTSILAAVVAISVMKRLTTERANHQKALLEPQL